MEYSADRRSYTCAIVFFFQAEDGIRDDLVTGVQTCALPIFAPRIGAAWRPFGNKTVFRAGLGIFYDIVPTAVNMAGVPFNVNEPSYTNPAGSPVVVLPNIFPAGGIGGPSSVSLPGAFKKDLRIPYSIQYNVTVERQIWDMGIRISYVGTGTRQSEYVYNFSQLYDIQGRYITLYDPFSSTV